MGSLQFGTKFVDELGHLVHLHVVIEHGVADGGCIGFVVDDKDALLGKLGVRDSEEIDEFLDVVVFLHADDDPLHVPFEVSELILQ